MSISTLDAVKYFFSFAVFIGLAVALYWVFNRKAR